MDNFFNILKTDMISVVKLAQYLIVAFFPIACFLQYHKVFVGQTNYRVLLVRTVVIFMILTNYVSFMELNKDIIAGVTKKITNGQNNAILYSQMLTKAEQKQRENQKQEKKSFLKSLGNFGVGNFTIQNVIVTTCFYFYRIVTRVMGVVQKTMIGILYKLGPLLLLFLLFDKTIAVVIGWYRSYLCTLSWPLLWSIILSLAVTISKNYNISGVGFELFIAVNFAVCWVIIFTPMIINNLVSGAGIGTAASIAGGMASKMTANALQRTAGVMTQSGAGTIRGGLKPMISSGSSSGVKMGSASLPRNFMNKVTTVTGGMIGGGFSGMGKSMGLIPSEGEKAGIKMATSSVSKTLRMAGEGFKNVAKEKSQIFMGAMKGS